MRVAAAAGEAGGGHGRASEVASTGTVAAARAQRAGRPSASPTWRAAWATALGKLAEGATSALVVPLAFRAGTPGLLVAFDRLSDGPAFEADDEHILASFARERRHRHRHRAVGGGRAAAKLGRGLRAGAAPLGARAPRRDAPGTGRAEGPAAGSPPVRPSRTPCSAAVDRAVDQIQLSISGLQGLITELRPAALDELGAGPALDALVKRTAATSGLDIRARLDLAYEQGRVRTAMLPRSRPPSTGSSRSRSRTWSSTPPRSGAT